MIQLSQNISEPTIDLIAILLIVVISGIAARFDKNERSIPTAILGIMGITAVLFLCTKWIILDVLPTVSDIMLIVLYIGMLGVMLLGKMFMARGDIIIIMITSAILPSVYNIPTIGITLGIALVVSTIYYTTKTFVPNLREFLQTRHIFPGIDDSVIRKLAAFFIVHKRTYNERFCFAGETTNSGHRRLVLLPKNLDDADIESRTEYVITAIPFMVPYFVGVCTLALIMILGFV